MGLGPSPFGGTPGVSTFGGGTALPASGGVIKVDTTSTGNTSTGETDLISYSLPANSLNANGRGVRITAFGSFAANANNKTVRLYFGATQLLTVMTVGSNNVGWRAVGIVIRTGATAQVANGEISVSDGNARVGTYTTPGETLSGAITLKVTGQSGTASNDILAKCFLVEAL